MKWGILKVLVIALDPRDGSVYVADFDASSVLKYSDI